MTTINVKIVGVEGDSVLIKYTSENSAKSIDDYEAVAYQPLAMGYTSIDDFIEGIKPGLLSQVITRDNLESVSKEHNISDWVGHESSHTVSDTDISLNCFDTADPLPSQVMVDPEVIL